jgi:hypothetical protein
MAIKAFPYEEWLDTTDPKVLNPIRHPGMDLRDYFASSALQGMLAYSNVSIDEYKFQTYATASYKIADKMMEARNGNSQ